MNSFVCQVAFVCSIGVGGGGGAREGDEEGGGVIYCLWKKTPLSTL